MDITTIKHNYYWPIKQAARIIHQGGVIAYPTESVYGLGCDPLNGPSVIRILNIKNRPLEKGLILIAANFDQLQPYLGEINKDMQAKLMRIWPEPVTWLLPASPEIPEWLIGKHYTIAVRLTRHPFAAALCDETGMALVSTSANISGGTPARTALQVRRKFGTKLDYIFNGECGPLNKPTEIRDALSGKTIR